MPLLHVERIAKSFGGIQALRGCTFDVEQGSVTGLIGPNGSGKTTMFNVITGYTHPESGLVQYHDASIQGQSPRTIFERGLGRTFQAPRIFGRLSLVENLKVPTRQGTSHEPSRHRSTEWAEEWLTFVGLAQHRQTMAGALSYGQRKLLEFAMVLAAEPDLVLLDEPAGGVNPSMIETMAHLIKETNGRGVTFLVVEHNMGFVMSLCHHVVVMHQGQVIADGSPDAIQSNPAVLDAYLGD